MEVEGEAATEAEEQVLFLFLPGEQELLHPIQGYVIMRRTGGILIAIPDGIIEEEALVPYLVPEVQGQEALMGSLQSFSSSLVGHRRFRSIGFSRRSDWRVGNGY